MHATPSLERSRHVSAETSGLVPVMSPASVGSHDTHALGETIATKPRAHWEELFLKVGVPSGPINNYAQAMEHPQVQHLKTRIGLPHATGVEAPGIASPMRFSKSPVTYRRAPPMLGQHTGEVLRELGLSAEEIEQLVKAGTIQLG